MATSTRSRKRTAEPATEVVKRAKQNKLCSLQNNDFLGFCSLREINYYETLKLDFERNFEAPQNDADFALLVARKANFVANQVRRYPSVTDAHHNNAVHDVLILIRHARAVLMDKDKRRRYDDIVAHKNSNVLKICDTFISQLDQINVDLSAALVAFKTALSALSGGAANDITSALVEALENWLAAQPVVMRRPSSMNRVLITWPPLLEEQVYTKFQTEQLVRQELLASAAIKSEDIVNVFVCDINAVVVEFKTQEQQLAAMKIDEIKSNRFTVKPYILKNFYTAQLSRRLSDEMNAIDSRAQNIREQLKTVRARYSQS